MLRRRLVDNRVENKKEWLDAMETYGTYSEANTDRSYIAVTAEIAARNIVALSAKTTAGGESNGDDVSLRQGMESLFGLSTLRRYRNAVLLPFVPK